MITRADQISKGKLFQVYHDLKPDYIIFEGSRNKCLQFVKKEFGLREYKNGNIRIGCLIWENSPKEYIDKE